MAIFNPTTPPNTNNRFGLSRRILPRASYYTPNHFTPEGWKINISTTNRHKADTNKCKLTLPVSNFQGALLLPTGQILHPRI